MSTSPDMVTSAIELRLIVVDGPDRAVHADLTYSLSDPYAVQVAFHTGGPEVVEWTFARSLLTDGVTHPVGDGDVQVWPASNAGQPTVCLSLSSPAGRALFEASLNGVVEFLTETYAVVPTGCESEFVDVDAELTSLFNSDL
jgi:hypothetical protein